jgi:transcriptional regulator with XRE-family HTH domain
MADEFGRLLKEYRKGVKLSQKQLLLRIRQAGYEERYSEADISKWEHGRTKPPEDVVEELEEILGIPKGSLLRAAGYRSAAEYRRLQAAEPTPSQAAASLRLSSVQQEERQRFLPLLQRWREQLEFLSIARILREFYFQNRHTDLEHEGTEPEEVRQAYLRVVVRHWETILRPPKAMLPIESESLFERLKNSYPDAEVWQAQELWGQACGIYYDAFSAWFVEVEYVSELGMGLAALETGDSGDFDGKVRDARQMVKETKRAKSDVWLFLRLLALTVACDLLVLGIEEQQPCAAWALEVEKIRKLRSDIVLASKNELPKDFWLVGANRPNALAKSLWNSDETVKDKTVALLKALEKLQIAQNSVHDKVKALERIAYLASLQPETG